MASSLLKKLNAIAPAKPAAPSKPVRSGLIVRRHSVPAEQALLAMDGARFHALGFQTESAQDCLFLDTETTGLSRGAGTVAFLVGLGYLDGNEFIVEQYLMRDYPDEIDLLNAVCSAAQRFRAIVTFNGANFDLLLLNSRLTMHRMRGEMPALENVDLLLPARKLWKLRLKSCRLANLEEHILGQPRTDDLPGSEVPGRYFEYLKTGNESLLTDVLEHNREDVISLGKLMTVLAEAYYKPEEICEQIDLFSAGRVFESRGEKEQAKRLYTMASAPRPLTSISALHAERFAGHANRHLYQLYRREGNWSEAVRILETMVMRRQLGAYPHVELAKYAEHKQRNLPEALLHAEKALKLANDEEKAAIQKRCDRIIRKLR